MAVIGGGGGGIKSIQRGSTTCGNNTTATATINAVDLAKSFISASTRNGANYSLAGYIYGAYSWNNDVHLGATLTNTTTVTFTSGHSYGGISNATDSKCYWEVIEYE